MRVRVKKEDRNSMIPGIIVTIIFLSVSTAIFITTFKQNKPIIEALVDNGIAVLFSLVFLGFGIYFVYALIKRPKAYRATLVNKKIETYNGEQITYMEFSTEKEQEDDYISPDYTCYTIGDNDLVVGSEYSLRIKEYNWEPKYVEEIDNSYEAEKKGKVKDKLPTASLGPVYIAIAFIVGGTALLCVIGAIMYPEYLATYLTIGVICGYALYKMFKDNKFK